MKRLLNQFAGSKRKLLKYFGCDDDYYIKLCTGYRWRLTNNEGVPILVYQMGAEPEICAVVAKKNGKPLIYETSDLTLVIAIDCIKIAFIMENILCLE